MPGARPVFGSESGLCAVRVCRLLRQTVRLTGRGLGTESKKAGCRFCVRGVPPGDGSQGLSCSGSGLEKTDSIRNRPDLRCNRFSVSDDKLYS